MSLVFHSANSGASGYLRDIDGPSSNVPALLYSTCLRSLLRLTLLRPVLLLHHLRVSHARMQVEVVLSQVLEGGILVKLLLRLLL